MGRLDVSTDVRQIVEWIRDHGGETKASFDEAAIVAASRAGLVERVRAGAEEDLVVLTPAGYRLYQGSTERSAWSKAQ